MMSPRRLILSFVLLCFATTLASCGDTWNGVKKDTGENLEATGNAMHNAGEKVKP